MTPDLPPNVLIVVMDDVGVDQVSTYGFPGAPATPTLDGLAGRGLRFDQAWAMPTCTPTRSSLMTGRLPYRNHLAAVIGALAPAELAPSEITLAEAVELGGQDWSTAAIGKWHLSSVRSPNGANHPRVQGFDQFAGSLNNLGAAPTIGLAAQDRTYTAWERVGFDGTIALETRFATTAVVDDAIQALGRMREPWLMYVGFHAAHRPLSPPPPELVGGVTVDPDDENALFAANVTAMDRELGRLLEALGPAGPRTLVVVLGDNGTPDYAKDEDGQEGEKGSLEEGGIRVPFVAAGPPVKARGQTQALASVTDLLPTVAALAGVTHVGVELDGVSLLPVFADPGARVRDHVWSEVRHPADGPPWRRVKLAIRDERYKVRREEDGTWVYTAIDGFTEREIDPRTLPRDDRKRVAELAKALQRPPVPIE